MVAHNNSTYQYYQNKMNCGNECYILYDKYGGGLHSFRNPITCPYNIKDLFDNKTDDGTTNYVINIEAVKQFNQKFGGGNFRLPNDLNHDIISIHMFNFKNADNCEVIITIVGIDHPFDRTPLIIVQFCSLFDKIRMINNRIHNIKIRYHNFFYDIIDNYLVRIIVINA